MNEGELSVTLPDLPEVRSNIGEIAAAVRERLAEYGAYEVSNEEDYKCAKAQRAALNKLTKAISSKRIEAKKAYLAPYARFEEQAKALEADIAELSGEYREQINAYDARRRERLRCELEERYAELAGTFADLVPLERIEDQKWYNRAPGVNPFDALADRVAKYVKQWQSLQALTYESAEEKSAALEWFCTNLPEDTGEVAVMLQARRERMRAVAEIQAGFEPPAPEPDPEPEPPAAPAVEPQTVHASDEPRRVYSFEFECTRAGMESIVAFCRERGIHGKMKGVSNG